MNEPVGKRSIASLRAAARRRLAEAGVVSPDLDARLLLEQASGLSPLAVLSDHGRTVSASTAAEFEALIERRAAGEPVHRMMGAREFYGLSFRLSPETLEPRPDTETLVDLALPCLRERIEQRGVADILDMGTGSGAIAVALLSQLEKARAVGVDISSGALDVARENAEAAGVTRRFAALRSHWFSAVRGRFDLIISNPPYISSKEIATLPREVRAYDPILALDGGADGLGAYRVLARRSADYLMEDGVVIVEIGAGQRQDVVRLFETWGLYFDQAAKDLAGLERALMFHVARPALAGG